MVVEVKIREGVIVLKPSGRLIGIASSDLGAMINAQLKVASTPPTFLFDFADVPRMDSAGLGVLLGVYVSVVRRGGRIGLINVNSAISNLLAMARLIPFVEWYDSETEAIAALRAQKDAVDVG